MREKSVKIRLIYLFLAKRIIVWLYPVCPSSAKLLPYAGRGQRETMRDKCFDYTQIREYRHLFDSDCLISWNDSTTTTTTTEPSDLYYDLSGGIFPEEKPEFDNHCKSVQEVLEIVTPMPEDFIHQYELGKWGWAGKWLRSLLISSYRACINNTYYAENTLANV